MTKSQVPQIFSEHRRRRRALRSVRRRNSTEAARFVLDEMADDVIDRLAFVRHEAEHPILIGAFTQELRDHLARGADALKASATTNVAEPFGIASHDLVVVIGQLDAINDLPGALIHIRNALMPGGLAIASFIGGASLPRLRAAMLAADGDRPSARMHPLVDSRAAPQLLQRAGWKDPVVDTHTLRVRYPSLDRLVSDLRDQGLTSALKDAAPPLGKKALERAREAFLADAEPDGKVTETLEIITLTGRRSLAGT